MQHQLCRTLFIELIVVVILATIKFASSCVVRNYHEIESFVCVCNQLNCDTIDTLPHSLTDHLTIFVSDKSSHRFTKSLIRADDLVYGTNQLFDIRVFLNVTDRRQSVLGFGGAFTDSVGININKLPNQLGDRLIRDYFSPVEGLGYTFGRVPIAGSDFSDRAYTYDNVEDDFELKHFKLTHDDYDYKIPLIKRALNLTSDLKLFSSSWGPPKWLKTNNMFGGLSILKGEPGSIYWKTYANYLVKFLESYKANGIDFWGLSPQNEPAHGLYPNWPLNDCGFSGAMMKDWIKKDLGPALAAAGFGRDKVNLMIWDDELMSIMPFVRSVLDDPEAAKYVSGVAYHWYSNGYYEHLNLIHKLYPEAWLLSTEASEGVRQPISVSLGNWTRAENYATDIIEGLNSWSRGWIDWNLVLDEQGGINWIKNYIDAPVIVNNTSPEYYKQPLFYVLGHFSRFIVPGSTHLSHMILNGNDDDVKMTTFITPSNEITFTLLNKRETSINLSIEGITTDPFKMTFGPRSITTIVTPI